MLTNQDLTNEGVFLRWGELVVKHQSITSEILTSFVYDFP